MLGHKKFANCRTRLAIPDSQNHSSNEPCSKDEKASDLPTTFTVSKFPPISVSNESSQPGTICVNISLVQTTKKSTNTAASKKNCDETMVCEISCEQSQEEVNDPCTGNSGAATTVDLNDCRNVTNFRLNMNRCCEEDYGAMEQSECDRLLKELNACQDSTQSEIKCEKKEPKNLSGCPVALNGCDCKQACPKPCPPPQSVCDKIFRGFPCKNDRSRSSSKCCKKPGPCEEKPKESEKSCPPKIEAPEEDPCSDTKKATEKTQGCCKEVSKDGCGTGNKKCDSVCALAVGGAIHATEADQCKKLLGKCECDLNKACEDILEVAEGHRHTKMQCCCLHSRASINADPAESFEYMKRKSQLTPSWKYRDPDPSLMKIDELTSKDSPGLYRGRRGKEDRFSGVFMGANESAEARSHKITQGSRCHIKSMYEAAGNLFMNLQKALDMILCMDFSSCTEILKNMQDFHASFVDMLRCLRYSPYEEDMLDINCGLNTLLMEVEVQPAFVLVRMVEFGYYLYEIGRLINEDFIPPCFVILIHTLQTRLFRLRSGRVIRQIFFVPSTYDPIVSTYYKSRQILRIEHFCHCKVALLPPEDPRAIDCPLDWRCLEVNFDEINGRHLAFKKLLHEACPVPSSRPILSIATVFRRLNGSEGHMSLEELANFETHKPRINMLTLTNDIRTRTGMAAVPRLRIEAE